MVSKLRISNLSINQDKMLRIIKIPSIIRVTTLVMLNRNLAPLLHMTIAPNRRLVPNRVLSMVNSSNPSTTLLLPTHSLRPTLLRTVLKPGMTLPAVVTGGVR